ncbi:MAG: hypothetical protein ABI772_11610 [Bacteroidota bacterium]
MNSLKPYLLIASLIVMVSCSESPKRQTGLYYCSDIDAMIGWYKQPSIFKTDNAHSGMYVSKIDSVNAYSVGFDIPNSEVNLEHAKVKEVKVTVWAWLSNENAKASLVVELKKGEQPLQWKEVKLQDNCSNPGDWCKVEQIVKLGGDLSNDDIHVRTYVINNSKEEVLIDDISIEYIN